MNLYDNPKYDFNYQFAIDLDPIKLYKVKTKLYYWKKYIYSINLFVLLVLQGDSLIIECRYNTMDRTDMTFVI